MTIDEYCDTARFPVTSHKGCSPMEQLRMDAFNLDALREEIELDNPLNERQQAALKELRIKEPHIGPLSAEVARQKIADQNSIAEEDAVPKHPALRPFIRMTKERLSELIEANRPVFDDAVREAQQWQDRGEA